MTSLHILQQTLDQVPYEPTRMATLIKKCHRGDSNLRHILNELVETGTIEKIEAKTLKGNKKVVWWKRIPGAEL